jgi:hypothetical protein
MCVSNNNNLIIFSVDQLNVSDAFNKNARKHALSVLKAHTNLFEVVEGVYTYEDGTKAAEVSFSVKVVYGTQSAPLIAAISELCKEYNQECYLQVSANGDAYLSDSQGVSRQYLGDWVTVETDNLPENYTIFYDEDTVTIRDIKTARVF